MKLVGLKEAKANLSAFVDQAQRDRILITRRGKPAALVIGVEGQDLEEILLASDPEFWETIQERRKHAATLTSDEVRRSLGLPAPGKPREPAGAKPKKRPRRIRKER